MLELIVKFRNIQGNTGLRGEKGDKGIDGPRGYLGLTGPPGGSGEHGVNILCFQSKLQLN